MIYLCFLLHVLQQDTITFRINTVAYSFSLFEKELIIDVMNLYKFRTQKDIYVVFKEEKIFQRFFKFPKNKHVISVNAITITEERKQFVSFSKPYFPVKQAILTTFKNKNLDLKNGQIKLCLEDKSLHYKTAQALAKKYKFVLVPTSYDPYYQRDIDQKKYDIFVSDIITSWSEKEPYYVLNADDRLLKRSYYAFVYKKNSPLKEEIDNVLLYYLKSPRYNLLVKKYFGKRAVEYIQSFH